MTDSELLSSFRQEANGDWICVKPVLIDGTVRNVAFVPGVTVSRVGLYMGVDIARELDEAAARQATANPEPRTPLHH